MRNLHELPDDLPAPADDGAADHLRGAKLPDVVLPCTSGASVLLSDLVQPTVLFFYPRTGVPGRHLGRGFSGEEWDAIPGARGCTPQSCAFRDLHTEFRDLGVLVFGVSTQSTAYQQEFKAREHIPFDYLSDHELSLTRAMRLPTFEFPAPSGEPTTLIRRMSWYVEARRLAHIWYPVFPPNENAATVLAWLQQQRS
jgi:peroxiredoxin